MPETRGVEWGRIARSWFAAARRRAAEETGSSLVEYAMLVSFIVMVALVAMSVISGPVSGALTASGEGLNP